MFSSMLALTQPNPHQVMSFNAFFIPFYCLLMPNTAVFLYRIPHVICLYVLPYYTLLYPTIPYYTLLYPTIPYYTLLYPTIPYCTLLYPTIPYYTLLYPTISYYTLLYTYYIPTIYLLYTYYIPTIYLLYTYYIPAAAREKEGTYPLFWESAD
jgi:hypothetical protein